MRKIVPDPPYSLDSGQKMHLSLAMPCRPPASYPFTTDQHAPVEGAIGYRSRNGADARQVVVALKPFVPRAQIPTATCL